MILNDASILNSVFVDADYVMQRIRFSQTLRDFLEMSVEKKLPEEFKTGDILIWYICKEDVRYPLNTRVCKNLPLSENIHTRHYAVCENPYIASHVAEAFHQYPSIRFSEITEIEREYGKIDGYIPIDLLLKLGLATTLSEVS